MSDTLGDIIFIQSLRSTVFYSLSQSIVLPRYFLIETSTDFTRFSLIHFCIRQQFIVRILALLNSPQFHLSTIIHPLKFISTWKNCPCRKIMIIQTCSCYYKPSIPNTFFVLYVTIYIFVTYTCR